jgi:hypothetical protein
MKQLLFLFCFIFITTALKAQYVHKIKGDSVLITNDSCSAELIVENSTKLIKGFLYNRGNGRTEFRKGVIKINDSMYLFGNDTLNFKNILNSIGIGGGISSLNSLTVSSQTFATGSSGNNFSISSSGSVHTFNLPNASDVATGVITPNAQTIAGAKTFSSAQVWPTFGLNSIPFVGAGKVLSHDSIGFSYNGTNVNMGKDLSGTYTGIYLNNARASIQAQLAGMRINIGSGFNADGTYDASKAYRFQNRGNNYLVISTSGTGPYTHFSTFSTHVQPGAPASYNLGNTSSRWKFLYVDSIIAGVAGTSKGYLQLAGNTSGTVAIQPAAAAGSWTLTLPTTSGTSGQVLTTDGTGVTTWSSAGSPSPSVVAHAIHANATADITLTNQSNSEQDFYNNARTQRKGDLSGKTSARIVCRVTSASNSANTPRLYLQYSTDGTTWSNIGNPSTPTISLASTGFKDTDWFTITSSAAVNNIYFRVAQNGGNNNADPDIAYLEVMFK